jgi:hypothetical protein
VFFILLNQLEDLMKKTKTTNKVVKKKASKKPTKKIVKKKRKTQLPGEKASGSGIFKEIGPRGGKVKNPKKVSVSRRKKTIMPPTREANRKWKPV